MKILAIPPAKNKTLINIFYFSEITEDIKSESKLNILDNLEDKKLFTNLVSIFK